MKPEQKEAWKRKVFERVKSEVYQGVDWGTFSKQIEHFIFIFGGKGLKQGQIPPHGRYEIWLPDHMEREILKEYKLAAVQEGLVKEDE